MMRFDDELSRGLQQLADEVDATATARVRSAVERKTSRSRKMMAFAAGLVAAVAVATGVNATGLFGRGANDEGGAASPRLFPDFISGRVEPGEPCPDATRLGAPTDLVRAGAGPIWMPSHALASSETLTGSWTCGDTPALVFEAGVTMEFDDGWDIADPLKRWAEMAQQWGRGHVEEVLGRPAFVQPAGEKDPFGGVYRGEVLVIVGTTLIRVHGNGEIPAERLADIINTIDVDQPLTLASSE
jgi:hypothetical protein